MVNLTQSKWNANRRRALHVQVELIDSTVGYFFIFTFDQTPVPNSDGSTIICPPSKRKTFWVERTNLSLRWDVTNRSVFISFFDNHRTAKHRSLIFGWERSVRVVIFSTRNKFGKRLVWRWVFYLDPQRIICRRAQIGPLTDEFHTQCFSTHLTTFAGGFLVWPAPIDWNDVSANADFTGNWTIYITLICIAVLFILSLIYARWQDKKDLEKVRRPSPLTFEVLVGCHAAARQQSARQNLWSSFSFHRSSKRRRNEIEGKTALRLASRKSFLFFSVPSGFVSSRWWRWRNNDSNLCRSTPADLSTCRHRRLRHVCAEDVGSIELFAHLARQQH